MVEVRGLAKWYGMKPVLRHVSCHLPRGAISLLAGGNGAGKSTFMRIVAGLARPSEGELRFTGDRPPRLGYLGHAASYYANLTVLENLAFWRAAWGLRLPDAALMALLERVDLAEVARERAHTLSRGMAQRLNLARTLLPEPELLLLDEPGTGLDATSQALLRREMAAARERGACVLVISHDLAGDGAVADRLLVLADGRLAHDGPVEELLTAGHTGEGASCCA